MTTRRQAQAAQTRKDILAAAHQLFLERGYNGATLASIARAAGVVVETVYRRQLELYAATQPGIHARAGPLLRVLVGAAAAAELAELWKQLEDERLAGMDRFAQLLAERGVLRPGLSADEARDLLWTLNSMAVHDLLVLQRGWSPERYHDWLAATLARALLPDRQSPTGRHGRDHHGDSPQ